MKKHARLAAPALLAALAVGCSAIPVKMHTETHVQHADGTVEHRSSDWEGTLDQLPAQLAKAGKELGDVTAQMAKELTDVPPPGEVKLADLDPALAKYKGKKGVDFIDHARDNDGKPLDFHYVRLDQPQFDEFFKTSQEIHALVHQTTHTVGQLRQVSAKVQGVDVDAKASLKAEVDKAMAKGDGEAKASARLRELAEVGGSLGVLVPQIVSKIGKLVASGEQLVASAPTALTNPKVLAHLDLVKKGLVTSVTVVKESGQALGTFAGELAGFGGKAHASLRALPRLERSAQAQWVALPASGVRSRRDEEG